MTGYELCFMRKKYIILPFLCFTILLFYACKEKEPEYPLVEVESVTTDDIEIYGRYVGLIRASRNVEIHARVEGFLERMTFSEGKKVEENEPLFYINNAPYKAKVEKAKAQLKKEEAQ